MRIINHFEDLVSSIFAEIHAPKACTKCGVETECLHWFGGLNFLCIECSLNKFEEKLEAVTPPSQNVQV